MAHWWIIFHALENPVARGSFYSRIHDGTLDRKAPWVDNDDDIVLQLRQKLWS